MSARVPQKAQGLEFLHVAGLSVVYGNASTAVDMLMMDAALSAARVYVLVNAHSAKLRREDAGYARVLADRQRVICLPDGASITAGARLLGLGDIGRCPGPDLLEAACAVCAASGISVFLLGGAPGVADKLKADLITRYPGLQVAGTFTPPYGEWPEAASQQMVRMVQNSGAQVLWLGVSAPKQEKWAYEYAEKLSMPIVCVGAAFDFASGGKKRAPAWMRRVGMEWLYRLYSEPRRMWRRYLVGNAQFLFDLVRYGRREAV